MTAMRKIWATRINNATASTYVGHKGTIFFDELTGALRISDGSTVGGQPLTLVANDFNFQFGDFIATTPPNGAAQLSSRQTNQDINIVSNGTGVINAVGNLHVHTAGSYNPNLPDADGAIFRVDSNGYVRILAPDAVSTNGAVNIIGSLAGDYQQPVNTGVMLHITGIAGSPGVPSRVYNDSQNAFSAFVARRYNGTALAPTAVLADEEIMRISGTAHNGTVIPGTGNQRIVYKALGNQTVSNQGGYMEFWATPQNTTTIAKVATLDNINGITSTKFIGPLTGDVTGTATTATTAGIVTTAAQPNITSVGTLTSLTVGGTGLTILNTLRFDAAQNNGTGNAFNKTGGTVTANGRTGQITSLADSLAKGAAGTFIVNNSTITNAKDVVIVNIASGATANAYAVSVTAVNATGSFNVTVTNNGNGALSEALVFNFAVIKVS